MYKTKNGKQNHKKLIFFRMRFIMSWYSEEKKYIFRMKLIIILQFCFNTNMEWLCTKSNGFAYETKPKSNIDKSQIISNVYALWCTFMMCIYWMPLLCLLLIIFTILSTFFFHFSNCLCERFLFIWRRPVAAHSMLEKKK